MLLYSTVLRLVIYRLRITSSSLSYAGVRNLFYSPLDLKNSRLSGKIMHNAFAVSIKNRPRLRLF